MDARQLALTLVLSRHLRVWDYDIPYAGQGGTSPSFHFEETLLSALSMRSSPAFFQFPCPCGIVFLLRSSERGGPGAGDPMFFSVHLTSGSLLSPLLPVLMAHLARLLSQLEEYSFVFSSSWDIFVD